MENYALRVKERDMIQELNKLKIERQNVTEKREGMEKELADLMKDFSDRKDIEIQAKLEVNEI